MNQEIRFCTSADGTNRLRLEWFRFAPFSYDQLGEPSRVRGTDAAVEILARSSFARVHPGAIRHARMRHV